MPLDQAPSASELLVQTTSSQTTLTSSSAGVQSTPAGALSPYAGNTAPSGWLICDGSAVSRTTYSALFAIIGITYGAGDGSTTFTLPDLSGRTVFGLAGASGHADVKTLAATDGVAIGSRRPTHKHTVVQPTITNTDTGHSHIFGREAVSLTPGGTPFSIVGSQPTHDASTDSATTGVTSAASGGTVGVQASTPTDTVPYIVMPWIIKT